MIDRLIGTELRELDRMRDALSLLFDHDGRALGFEDLAERYDRGCRRLEALALDGSLSRAELDALRDSLDWLEHLYHWRSNLLAGNGPAF